MSLNPIRDDTCTRDSTSNARHLRGRDTARDYAPAERKRLADGLDSHRTNRVQTDMIRSLHVAVAQSPRYARTKDHGTVAVRTISTLAGIVALVAILIYSNFGTLSPCSMLRETVRQRDRMAAVLPDSIVDLALAAQYGA